MTTSSVYLGGGIATMVAGAAPYGAIADGALVVQDGRIVWVGPRAALPAAFAGATRHDLAGGWLTPGLIDCHTTPGLRRRTEAPSSRAACWAAITRPAARAGGGILSTVAATRAASEADLLAGAASRLARLRQDGVTTVEIKSGYGLTLEAELKMLRVARAGRGPRLCACAPACWLPTPCRRNSPAVADTYLDHVIADILPAAVGLADAVDAFAENIAFSRDQVARLFRAAVALGLSVKLHADQLSDGGGAALAASFGALSADHLEYTSEAGARAMAQSGTVAVLLPGAYATVGATQPPPIAAFRAHGVRMAVATDCNPGSSPMSSLLMAMNLACCLFRLTPEEALAGRNARSRRGLGIV